MAKRRVCHITTVHGPLDTRIFYKECLTLSADYEVHMIAPEANKSEREGVFFHALPKVSNRLSRILKLGPLAFWKALSLKADLYHFHDPEWLPWGLLLQRLGKRVVYDIHEDVLADLMQKSWLPAKGLSAVLYRNLNHQALKRLHLVFANDLHYQKYQEKAASAVVVRNYAWPPLFHLPEPLPQFSRPKLLLVGSLAAARGLRKILEAVYLLKQGGVEVEVVTVGKKDERVERILGSFAQYHIIEHQFIWEGYRPLPKAYLSARDCLAGLALLEPLENNISVVPTKLYEYMATGLPVIASDFPSNRDLIGRHDCGIVVNPEDAAAIADAMLHLIENTEKVKAMGMNGKNATMDFYSWNSEAKTLKDFYRSILAQ